jgi:hypothetical protein
MLDLIEEGAFVAAGSGRLQPVSKTAVFNEFMAPLDLEEEIAARDAEVASPSWSIREWWRSQATRSPCRPASGAAGRFSPDPTHGTKSALARRRRQAVAARRGQRAQRQLVFRLRLTPDAGRDLCRRRAHYA